MDHICSNAVFMITTKLISPDDAFCGEVTDVNVWNETLNDTEFEWILTSCGHAAQGNIVSWRDMSMAELVGTSIQIPSLCDGKSLFVCCQFKKNASCSQLSDILT